jgi:Helix-turn-helix domain
MSGRTNKTYCAPLEAEGLHVEEAVVVSGIGRSKLYEYIKNGELDARKSGKRTIVLRSGLMKLLENLPRAGEAPPNPACSASSDGTTPRVGGTPSDELASRRSTTTPERA